MVSTTNGLYVLNQDFTIHEHYGQLAIDRIGLAGLQIFHTVYFGDALWSGSVQGLIFIDTLHRSSRLFTTDDGLSDNKIYAVLPDERVAFGSVSTKDYRGSIRARRNFRIAAFPSGCAKENSTMDLIINLMMARFIFPD